MLSGEGNANGEKTTVALISKKATLHVHHTFLVHFFAFVLHDYNVKLPETLWRKCRTCSCSLFFTAALFHLSGRYHFSFPHRRYKFSCCSSDKKCLLCFISLALLSSLSLFFSLSFAGLSPTFSLSLSFSFSIFQIRGHENWSNISLIL